MSTYRCGTDVKHRTCAGYHVLTLGRLISADETFFFFFPVRAKNGKPAVPKLSCLESCPGTRWRRGGLWFAGRRPSNSEELQPKNGFIMTILGEVLN